MQIELQPKEKMSFDIDIKKLYNFCKEREYINNGEVDVSIYEILCEFLGINGYVENEDSELAEDELRCALNEMAEDEENE